MIGKVIINENGQKAISFDDAALAALPVGATIYAAGNDGAVPDSRQQFEASWRLRHPLHDDVVFKRSGLYQDDYCNTRVRDAWWAWQDREAVNAIGRTALDTIVEGLATEASGVIEKGIVEELERLRTDLATLEQACKEALPGVYYMDPPDGGDVSLGEQVLRMGNDAQRYRKWRHGASARIVETAKALCYAGTPEQIDQAIDSLNWEG